MKILIVSYWFPPQNVIGAVRVGKLAKYLREHGHEVKVVTSMPSEPDQSLPLEIDEQDVVRCSEVPIDTLFDALFNRLRGRRGGAAAADGKKSETEQQVTETSPRPGSFAHSLRRHYYALLQIPDKRGGWLKGAVEGGRRMLAEWRADVIVASSPPVTALLVARRLSGEFSIPWVADLRDLWTDNPYYDHPGWRKCLDEIAERRVLRTAARLITVSPPWAETLRSKFGRPTHVLLNGYVEEDFPDVLPAPGPARGLTIVYTGNIYRGYRDPTPLFAALRLLGERGRDVRIRFYGPSEADVRDLAAEQGVGENVTVERRVTYRESLSIQMQADILLLLQWNNRADEGNIPAKFFEYIGAGRPILFHGYEAGTLAEMIREREVGFVGNDPGAIADQLGRWIEQYEHGGVPGPSASARRGLSRNEQFRELAGLLENVVN